MSLTFSSFAGQNWTIAPAALAVNEAAPANISGQKWLLTLTGVGVLDLQGNNVDDWRRETLTIFPDIQTPLRFAIETHGIPVPPGITTPAISLEQWAPFAALSSVFDKDSGGVDAGYAVDVWRPTHFLSTTDAGGRLVQQIFTGIDVDIAVRNTKATLHRVSYHILLLGRIVFLAASGTRKR